MNSSKPCPHKDHTHPRCPVCKLAETSPRHRAAWGLPPLPQRAVPPIVCRDDADRNTFAEVVTRNEYRLPERFAADDVIVDVGAHAGYFARACLLRGAGTVVCVEPNPQNYAVLATNTGGFAGQARIVPAAAWRSDQPAGTRTLGYAPGDGTTTGLTVVGPAGQLTSVGTIGLDEVIGTIGKRIRLLKLDCEGAEWPILFTSRKLWDVVDEVVGEVHLRHLDFLPEDARVAGVHYGLDALRDLFTAHGWSFTARPNAVGHHTFRASRAEQETVLADVSAGGVGDHLMALTVCAGLRAAGRHVTLMAKHRDWCELFPTAYSALTGAPAKPRGINLIQTYFRQELPQKSPQVRWKYYADALGYAGRPVRPPAKIPPSASEWAEPYRGAVVLSPYSTYGARTWLLPHWLALEAALLQAGHRVVIIDHAPQDPKRCDAFRSQKVLLQSPARVAALGQGALALVGNDSGMAHLGGILGTRTVALCGFTLGEKVFAVYPSVVSLQGVLPCSGCYGQAPYQPVCASVCASLQTITVERVLVALDLPAPPPRPVAATPSVQAKRTAALACIHKGAPTGETRECAACGGRKVRLKVLACAKHGGCLDSQASLGLGCCRVCPDRVAPV